MSYASVGALQVPVSASAGPLHRSGPVWSCYAHTPMGAVIAAYVIPAQLATRNWRTVADQAVVHDPARATFLRLSAHQTFTPLSPDEAPAPVGWQVVTYSPRQATVQVLATAAERDSWQVTSVNLTWAGGDWKLAMTNAGAPATDPQPLADTAGYTKWSTHG